MNRRKPAESVKDIFAALGGEKARKFIRDTVHEGIEPQATAEQATATLEKIHYHMHKDIPDLAALAVEKYNRRYC